MCAGVAQKEALDLLHRWGGQPLPLNASAWVHDSTANPGDDYLFVRLRGAVAAVESALTRMSADAQALGARVSRMDKAEAQQDWRASGEQQLQFFEPPAPDLCLWRLSVPQTAPVLALPQAQYIEWHGAQRWLWASASAAVPLREAARHVEPVGGGAPGADDGDRGTRQRGDVAQRVQNRRRVGDLGEQLRVAVIARGERGRAQRVLLVRLDADRLQEDLRRALVALLDSRVEGAVNIGSGHAVTIRAIADRLTARLGRPELVEFAARDGNGTEIPLVVADTKRLTGELHWKPAIGLDHGLDLSIDWWRRHTCRGR
mgnify:CR=1 FL=1